MDLALKLLLGPDDGGARLPAPANLSVTEGAGTIDFSFDPVPGATEYQYTTGSGWVSLALATSATGVAVPYGAGSLSVRAMNGADAGYSASEGFYIDYPAPAAPTGLLVSPNDPDPLDFAASWTPAASYVAGTEVQLDAGAWVDVLLDTTYTGSAAAGDHTLSVRHYNVDGLRGPAATSDTFSLNDPSASSTYLRPDGVSTYFRPDGTSRYLRP